MNPNTGLSYTIRLGKYFHEICAKYVKRRKIDFKADPVIPVVVTFVIADFKYFTWNEELKCKPGKHVLLFRRSFEVGAMQGLWSGSAGVDDVEPNQKFYGYTFTDEMSVRFKALEEIVEETGWMNVCFDTVRVVGSLDQENPGNPEQIFRKNICVVDYDIPEDEETPAVALDYEHLGACWIPYDSMLEYLETNRTDDPLLKMVLDDGVTPDLWKNFALVVG